MLAESGADPDALAFVYRSVQIIAARKALNKVSPCLE